MTSVCFLLLFAALRSRNGEEWTESEKMGAFVLVAARIDAERRAKKAELDVIDAKKVPLHERTMKICVSIFFSKLRPTMRFVVLLLFLFFLIVNCHF